MNQKRLLIVLACTALLIFAVAGLGVGGVTLGWFGAGDGSGARPLRGAMGDGLDGHSSDFPGHDQSDGIAGRDLHGPYRVGEDGQRVYSDDKGRFYILDSRGRRIFTDAQGRPLSAGKGAESAREGGQGPPATVPVPEQVEGEDGRVTISGVVVDEAGKPFEGANVTVQVPGGVAFVTSSRADGTFARTSIPAGVQVEVRARSAAGALSDVVSVTPRESLTLPRPLVLARDSSIRGVVRAQSGGALQGAEVVLYEGTSGFGTTTRVRATAVTGPDGEFGFADLPSGHYRLQVSRDGFAPAILASLAPPRTVDVVLDEGASISGRVTDTEGEPIKGALISCDFDAEPAQRFHTEAKTNADGHYAVRCQPESQHNVIRVMAPGFHARSRSLIRSGTTDLDFKLQPTGNVILRGRLVRKTGEAVAAATLTALNAEGRTVRIAQRIGPAADGEFWAEVVPEGVRLRVRSTGLAQLLVDYTPVEGGEVQLGDLVMDSGVVIHGQVREAGELPAPIENALVRAAGVEARTDAQGRYRLEGLPLSALTLTVVHEAYAPFSVKLTPTAAAPEILRNVELTSGNLEARLIVRDALSQEPLPGAVVRFGSVGREFTAGADGIILMTQLTQTSIPSRVELDGYAPRSLTVAAGAPANVASKPPQVVLLEPGGTIHGLLSGGGQPLAGVRVEVWDSKTYAYEGTTASDGRYRTRSLLAGDYYVVVPKFGLVSRVVSVPVEGVEMNLEAGPVCHLRGRVLRAGGSGHGNAGVYVYRRDSNYLAATVVTDPDGRYEVQNLFPGEWMFCVLKSQGDQAAQFAVPVNVGVAGWSDVDVQLPQATGVITGRVTYTTGGPVRRARVCVTNLSANFARACLSAYVVTDNDGNFRAERLENGAQVMVRVGGYADEAATALGFSDAVMVPAGEAPLTVNLSVGRESVAAVVDYRMHHGGPMLDGGALGYVTDAQGRLAGLYFGNGRFNGKMALRDLGPGAYTLTVTARGCRPGSVNFVVGNTSPVLPEVLLEPETRDPE